MKIVISKSVYDQFDAESRRMLTPIPCDCVVDGKPSLECDSCDGGGIVYEHTPSAEDQAAIHENLRSQGVPLGKLGTQ